MRDVKAIFSWSIYKIVNPVGSVYIGKTRNLENRIKQYKYGSHPHQRLISASIKRHGYLNHSIDVIDSFSSDEKYAEGKEIFWIRSFMSNVNLFPEMNGLNLTIGGSGSFGVRMSEYTKSRMRESKRSKSKPVLCYDLNGNYITEYPSINAAARGINVQTCSIVRVLKGDNKRVKNYILKYK